MATSQLIIFDSPQAIRNVAAPWDDLWRRSDRALPVAWAELTAQWLETFAPRSRIACLAVRDGGQLVAVLPLVGGRLKRILPVGRLPTNPWSWAGDLLVDRAANQERATELLVEGIQQLRWPLLWLDGAPLDTPRWQHVIAALNAGGLLAGVAESFQVGQVEIDHDWSAYQASWPGNHRRQMRKMLRRAERDGGVELKVTREFVDHNLEALLWRGFEAEDHSWKGPAGSSVLRNPLIFRFICAQARHLAERGELQLTFLEHRGRAIAFEYGWNVGGVYGSAKVGYDEQFAELTPGQLLRYLLLERMFADPEQHRFDFLGPLTPATAPGAPARIALGGLWPAPAARSANFARGSIASGAASQATVGRRQEALGSSGSFNPEPTATVGRRSPVAVGSGLNNRRCRQATCPPPTASCLLPTAYFPAIPCRCPGRCAKLRGANSCSS